jgi:hypothetical protein
MPKSRFTLKEINCHIKDEAGAVKEYKHDKLLGFSRDENKHLKYWQEQKKLLIKLKKK